MKWILITIIIISSTLLANAQNSKVASYLQKLKYVRQDTIKARLYNEIGKEYTQIKPDSGIFFYNKSVSLICTNKNDSSEKIIYQSIPDFTNSVFKNTVGKWMFAAHALKQIGLIFCQSKGKNDTAFIITEKALAIYNQLSLIKDPATNLKAQLGVSGCNNNIGLIYSDWGNYSIALGYYEKSVRTSQELINSTEQTIALEAQKVLSNSFTNIGLLFYFQGKYPDAIEYFQKSLKIDDKIGDKQGMSYCYVNTGLIHKDQENYPKAIEYFQKARKIFEEIGDKKGIAGTFNSIGSIYHKEGDQSAKQKNNVAANSDYFKAIEYFQKALQIYSEINNRKRMSNCFNNIGLVYYSQHKYFMTLENFNKALNIYQEIGDKNGISLVLGNIAELNITLADSLAETKTEKEKYYNEAINKGLQALNLAKEIKSVPLQNSASENLYKVYKALKNTNKALEFAELYLATKDTMFKKEKTKAIAEMETKYQAEKKQLQIEKLEKDKELQTSDMKKQRVIMWFVVCGLLFVVIVSVVLFRLFLQKKKANKIITEKNEEIILQRDNIQQQKELIELHQKEIEDSINYAKRIQQAVMPNLKEILNYELGITNLKPETPFLIPNLIILNYFVLFKPKDVVSGDFYWSTKLNDWLIVTVADCTGHGVPGAFMSMLGISFLNEIVRKKEVLQANTVLDELRNSIIDALKQKGETGEQKDGMDIALIVINTKSLEMQFAGANNPVWIVKKVESYTVESYTVESYKVESYKVESCKVESDNVESEKVNDPTLQTLQTLQTFELYELKGDKQPIGIYEKMHPFTNHIYQLQKGDTIYLKSDGFEDQFGGLKHKKYLSKNLKQLLMDNSKLLMEEQKELLETTFNEWQGKEEQVDDITVLGLKI